MCIFCISCTCPKQFTGIPSLSCFEYFLVAAAYKTLLFPGLVSFCRGVAGEGGWSSREINRGGESWH